MKCINCHARIRYMEKVKLSMKNMYKIQCPHCGEELCMTTVSKFIYSVIIFMSTGIQISLFMK